MGPRELVESSRVRSDQPNISREGNSSRYPGVSLSPRGQQMALHVSPSFLSPVFSDISHRGHIPFLKLHVAESLVPRDVNCTGMSHTVLWQTRFSLHPSKTPSFSHSMGFRAPPHPTLRFKATVYANPPLPAGSSLWTRRSTPHFRNNSVFAHTVPPLSLCTGDQPPLLHEAFLVLSWASSRARLSPSRPVCCA